MAADISFSPERELSDVDRAGLARRQYVEALHRERDGYVRHGRTDRAAAVEAELAAAGAPLEITVVPAASRERAVRAKPETRKS